VKQPDNKPNSLEFFIADGYTTPNEANSNIYDSDLQKEMKAIIIVLNNLFDEDNLEFYVGDKNKISYNHNKTDPILELMNSYTKHVTRKNKGVKLNQRFNHKTKNSQNKLKKKHKKYTRKNHKHRYTNSLKNHHYNLYNNTYGIPTTNT
jgi:hypothetical protein